MTLQFTSVCLIHRPMGWQSDTTGKKLDVRDFNSQGRGDITVFECVCIIHSPMGWQSDTTGKKSDVRPTALRTLRDTEMSNQFPRITG